MQLNEYFSILNLSNLLIFLIVFIIFDSLGLFFAKFIKPDNSLRLTFWIWGMGIFTFLLFLMHLFLPLKSIYIWILLIISALASFQNYIKQRGIHTLISRAIKFPFPLIVLLIILKPLFFLLSAPPYYADEMNYQLYSPARLLLENRWPFISSIGTNIAPSLYEMIPKSLNSVYWALFSLTQTYAVARLLHFLIVFSVIYTIAIILRKRINFAASIIYSVFALLLSANFIYFSTLGYVDAAPAVLANLFLILIADFLAQPSEKKLYSAAVIFGLMIGMKYTITLFGLTVILSGFILILVVDRNKNLLKLKSLLRNHSHKLRKSIFIFSLIIILFGGYWYFKNLLISGNPIYPLFFKCLYGWSCGVRSAFFSGWSFPFDYTHAPNILMELFQNSSGFVYSTFIVVIFTLIFSLISKNRYTLFLSLLIFFSVVLEIVLSKSITGFVLRYYFHWLLLIPLILIMPFALFNLEKKHLFVQKKILFPLIILFLLYPAMVLTRNIKRFYEGDYVPGYVRNYAMHRISLNDWFDYYYPQMNNFIRWCSEKKSMQNIVLIDPTSSGTRQKME